MTELTANIKMHLWFVLSLILVSLTEQRVKSTTIKFVYFLKVCVFFARARISLEKDFEVKHTIYVGWP